MHRLETKVAHEPTGWRVDLHEDDGEEVSIKVAAGSQRRRSNRPYQGSHGSVGGIRHLRRWPPREPLRWRKQWQL